MSKKTEIKQEIIKALSKAHYGATITEIEKQIKYERHTIAKYLTALEGEGIVDVRIAGKAKFWFINKAPLQTITKAPPESRSYIENVLLQLLSQLPSGVIVIDRDYNIQYANKEMKEVYGEIDDKKFYEEVLGQRNPLNLRKIEALIDFSTVQTATVITYDKHDSILNIKASKIVNPDNSISVILMIEDITEQTKINEQMKKLSLAVEQTADMIMITDREGIIEYVNPAFEQETGYASNEIIGKKPSVLKSGKHTKQFYATMWKTILSGKPYHGLVIDKKKNGGLLYEQKTITPLFENKKITHFVSTGKILMEQKRIAKKKKITLKEKRNLH